MSTAASRPSPLAIWAMAARPRTLSAAIVPVLVGTALAADDRAFVPGPAAAALAGAILIQIGANMANDYADARRGADAERRGPVRVTQSGLVTPRQIRIATAIVFALAAVCGIYLIAVAGWPILVIGLASILAALAYTAGPYPLGYHGYGDLFVLIFFGFVALGGTYFAQAHYLSPRALLLAVPIGLLTTAILTVNNLRDADTDRRAGKLTLVARFGRPFGRIQYTAMLVLAYAGPLILVRLEFLSPWGLLPLLSSPLAISLLSRIHRAETTADYGRALAGTSMLLLVFGLLLAIGVLL